MKRFLLIGLGVVFAGVGCRFGQGESPNQNQQESSALPERPIGSNKPGAPMPTPMAVAGDPVVGQSKPKMPAGSAAVPGRGSASTQPPPSAPARPMMTMTAGPFNSGSIRADKEVSGSYRSPEGASISVEAVCKVTEDSLICLGPDGKRNKDLEAKLDKILQGNQDHFSPGITFTYKKKNRHILFRKEFPMQPTGPMAYLSILQVGEGPTNFGPSFFNLSQLNPPFTSQGPRVEYEMRSVAVPFNQNRVNVYISSTKQEPLDGTIELKRGAKLASGKVSLTFSSLKSVADAFGPGTKAWEITFKVTRPDDRTSFAVSPIVRGVERGYAMVDENGDVFSNLPGEAPSPSSRRRSIRTPMAMPVSIVNQEMKVRTNVNPKHLEGLQVSLLRTETIKLKNVPLD